MARGSALLHSLCPANSWANTGLLGLAWVEVEQGHGRRAGDDQAGSAIGSGMTGGREGIAEAGKTVVEGEFAEAGHWQAPRFNSQYFDRN